MKRKIYSVMVFLCLLFFAGCASTNDRAQSDVLPMPHNRDDAAQFLAQSQQENWDMLYQINDGGVMYVNPDRVVKYGDGITDVWMKMQFQYALLTPFSQEPVIATLMHTQVKCDDSTYRTDAWYALNSNGEVVDVVTDEMADFTPLGLEAAAPMIYALACR